MFDQIFKKRKMQNPPPKGGGDDSEKIDVPDVDDALANIDAALAEAEVAGQEEVYRREANRRFEAMIAAIGGGCGCGGPPPKKGNNNY